MMRLNVLLLFFLVFGLVFCTSQERKQEAALEQIRTDEHYIDIQLEQGIPPEELTDRSARLIDHYLEFQEKFPDHFESPEFMFKAGKMQAEIYGDFESSIRTLKGVQQEYEDKEIAERALFMAGFMYGYELDDPESAREVYAQFLQTYPDSELAEGVKGAHEYTGTDPGALIRELPYSL